MFVIAGVTGHVGSVAAHSLMEKGQKIKVLVRDEKKGKDWSKKGAEVAIGDLENQEFLTAAFKGAKSIFLLLPPNWASKNILADQKKLGATMAAAVKAAHVPHVVLLSSNGADLADGTGPIKGLFHFENALRGTGTKVTAIRAGMFMENVGQAIMAAKSAGIYPNMIPSRDMAMPMIATKDIGQLVAQVMMEGPKTEIICLNGPAYSINQLAEKVSKALSKKLNIVDIPQSGWLNALTQAGVPQPWAEQYVEMYNGLLAGTITAKGDRTVVGKTEVDEVIKGILS